MKHMRLSNMKRGLLLCVLMVGLLLLNAAVAAADTPQTADLFRYIPTQLIVDGQSAKVKGYFINMSDDTITGIGEDGLDMSIYIEDELCMQGHFNGDNLHNMKIDPKGMVNWTFEYSNGGSKLNNGDYVVDSDCYAKFSCRFSSR